AEIDADTAADGFRAVGLRPPVSLDAKDLEAHLALPPAGIDEGEREIAIDAATDPVALGMDADRLRHGQGTVLRDSDVGMVAVEILLRPGCAPDQKAEPQ